MDSTRTTATFKQQSQVFRWLLGALLIARLIFVMLGVGGYLLHWEWTGLVKRDKQGHWQIARSLWDWLQLLLFPIVVAAGVAWFNLQQKEYELRVAQGNRETDLQIARENREKDLEIARNNREKDLDIAQQNRATDLRIADDRAQDLALETYLSNISNLLLDKDRPLLTSDRAGGIRDIARAWTLSVLPRLDGRRKGRLQWLTVLVTSSTSSTHPQGDGATCGEQGWCEPYISHPDVSRSMVTDLESQKRLSLGRYHK